jgi:hypothetical protein
MAEANAAAVADGVASQLSGLFRELADRDPVSRVAGVRLADAAASGRAVRLYIFRCDSDDLSLVSTFRRWWVADADGFRLVADWPLTTEQVRSDWFGVEFPYVRFGTDGRRVRLGMRFGPSWYLAREGPLAAGGGFDVGQLIDPYPSLG